VKPEVDTFRKIRRWTVTAGLFSAFVLDSAAIGLIFTRSQEGTQPGLMTQTSQTSRVFGTM